MENIVNIFKFIILNIVTVWVAFSAFVIACIRGEFTLGIIAIIIVIGCIIALTRKFMREVADNED